MAPAEIFCQNALYDDVKMGHRRRAGQTIAGESVMKAIAGLTVVLAILAGSAAASDLVRVEQASAGKPYDYIVHVQNTYSIGYNPEVREDRFRMAMRSLRGVCRDGWVVGDDKIRTEIFGLISSRPDYVVLVKCA